MVEPSFAGVMAQVVCAAPVRPLSGVTNSSYRCLSRMARQLKITSWSESALSAFHAAITLTVACDMLIHEHAVFLL
jgi:hypothetical protein